MVGMVDGVDDGRMCWHGLRHRYTNGLDVGESVVVVLHDLGSSRLK